MAEETPSTQPAPKPTTESEPKKEGPKKEEEPEKKERPEKKEEPPKKEAPPKKEVAPKKKGGWFQKIPADILLSPGGVVLIIYFTFTSILDLIPLYPFDQFWEIPLEIIGAILLKIIAGVSFWYLLIPFIVERLDVLGIIPSELIRLFF